MKIALQRKEITNKYNSPRSTDLFLHFLPPSFLNPSLSISYNPKDRYFQSTPDITILNESISSKEKKSAGEKHARDFPRRGTSKRMTSGSETHGHRNNTGRNEEKETSKRCAIEFTRISPRPRIFPSFFLPSSSLYSFLILDPSKEGRIPVHSDKLSADYSLIRHRLQGLDPLACIDTDLAPILLGSARVARFAFCPDQIVLSQVSL